MGDRAGGPGPSQGQRAGSKRGRSARGSSRSCSRRRCRALPRTSARLEAPGVATATGEAGGARAAGARPAAARWGRWGPVHPDQGAVTPHKDRSPAAPAPCPPAVAGCWETRGQRGQSCLRLSPPPASGSFFVAPPWVSGRRGRGDPLSHRLPITVQCSRSCFGNVSQLERKQMFLLNYCS